MPLTAESAAMLAKGTLMEVDYAGTDPFELARAMRGGSLSPPIPFDGVAMRDIAAGEELTFDYAMSDDDDYDEFVCACGEPGCRGLVTGADWRRPELQDRYRGWFSNHIARRIEAEADTFG